MEYGVDMVHVFVILFINPIEHPVNNGQSMM